MKFFILLSLLLSGTVLAGNCPQGLIKIWTQKNGHQCVPRFFNQNGVIEECLGVVNPLSQDTFSSFPLPLVRSEIQPWWAIQGSLYYPNLNYPGPWKWPGIDKSFYPGAGDVFAAKPNVYVETVTPGKKFEFKFDSREKPYFLATTPLLSKQLSWKGKLDSDKFEVDEIYYDYLFYDVRFPKESMQFEHGLCSTREGAIQWMLNDLKSMRYPEISLQDFEEHWRVKIPDFPYYCIYPQYNAQIDPVLPVKISLDQHIFVRSLYVLVPHRKEPDADDPVEIPFPIKDPAIYKPNTLIKREVEFREWGVAFLGY